MTDKAKRLSEEQYPISAMFKWPLLSSRKPDVQLKTNDPTPLSSQMNWPLLNYALGEGRVQLTTGTTPLSSRMGWPLLSDKSTMFDTQLSTPGGTAAGGKSGDSPFSKFIRGIMTGEVQK